MKITPKMIRAADEKYNFIVGYRNLFNIVVLAVGTWFIIESQTLMSASPGIGIVEGTGGIIVMILGGKWFLSQVRQNLDIIEIKEQLPPAPIREPGKDL